MHASLKRIQHDDNAASSKFGRYSAPGWKPLATIAYNTKLTALHGREVAMCVNPCVFPYVRVTRRATCVCGLRRLTIRDAGIYGRGVHADCRNGASDATDKMISLFPSFFFPLCGSNCEVSIMRGRWHRKHTRGFGGGMPGSAAMISIARVGRRGSQRETFRRDQ